MARVLEVLVEELCAAAVADAIYKLAFDCYGEGLLRGLAAAPLPEEATDYDADAVSRTSSPQHSAHSAPSHSPRSPRSPPLTPSGEGAEEEEESAVGTPMPLSPPDSPRSQLSHDGSKRRLVGFRAVARRRTPSPKRSVSPPAKGTPSEEEVAAAVAAAEMQGEELDNPIQVRSWMPLAACRLPLAALTTRPLTLIAPLTPPHAFPPPHATSPRHSRHFPRHSPGARTTTAGGDQEATRRGEADPHAMRHAFRSRRPRGGESRGSA